MSGVQPNVAHPRYRPDIDGLRALAIAAVVFYHCRFGAFAGGFVGVDVFFVISGYLIALLVYGPMREGRFSFAEFWERRIRRIFPMLAVMLAATAAVSLFVLFPADLKRFADSFAAAAAFVSNFQFYGEAGYFDAGAAQKPILHTWSLGAEAQFYLVFPPILYVLRKTARGTLFAVLGILMLASFALSVWAVREAPAFAFYLIPARMWELLAGVMLAIAPTKSPQTALVRSGLSLTGLALIGWSIFTLTPDSLFPGENALAPCLGAVFIIHAGEASLVNRLLGAKPVASLGVISYSLYLWHWPVLTLARYYLFRDLTFGETLAALAVCLALAVLSWRFVEQPFLRRKLFPTRLALMRFAGLAAVVLALGGGAVSRTKGLPQRFSPGIQQLLAVSEERPDGLALCFNPVLSAIREGHVCEIGASGRSATNFLLWGDSHAEAIAPAVAEAAKRHGRLGLYAARGSCPPLLGVTSSRGTGCRDFAGAIVDLALEREVDEVVIAAYWADYSEGTAYAPGGGNVFLTDDANPAENIEHNRQVFAAGLERTVARLTLAKMKVVLVAPIPEIAWPVPETLARLEAAHDSRDIRPGHAQYFAREAFVLKTLEVMRAKYGVTILRPDEILCATGKCEVVRGGHPLYRDAHHLTTFGANQLLPELETAFE